MTLVKFFVKVNKSITSSFCVVQSFIILEPATVQLQSAAKRIHHALCSIGSDGIKPNTHFTLYAVVRVTETSGGNEAIAEFALPSNHLPGYALQKVTAARTG